MRVVRFFLAEPFADPTRSLENIFFKVTPADNGKFFNYTGENLPW